MGIIIIRKAALTRLHLWVFLFLSTRPPRVRGWVDENIFILPSTRPVHPGWKHKSGWMPAKNIFVLPSTRCWKRSVTTTPNKINRNIHPERRTPDKGELKVHQLQHATKVRSLRLPVFLLLLSTRLRPPPRPCIFLRPVHSPPPPP